MTTIIHRMNRRHRLDRCPIVNQNNVVHINILAPLHSSHHIHRNPSSAIRNNSRRASRAIHNVSPNTPCARMQSPSTNQRYQREGWDRDQVAESHADRVRNAAVWSAV